MKSVFVFGGLIICVCIVFASLQLNTYARYQLEHVLQENGWEHNLTYTDTSHKLFSTTGQMLGVKLYAYPHLSIEKLTVAEMTPTKAVVVLHNMDLDVLHALQRQPDVEKAFRTYQPITHLLARPLHSLLLIGKPMVRMNGKLIVSKTKQKAIVDMTVNAAQVGQLQMRVFLYPVSDRFIHDLMSDLLQGHIGADDLAKLPIVKIEMAYTDNGGLKAYREYLDTLPGSLIAQAKKNHPQLTQIIVRPKSEMKLEGHPFKRTQNKRSKY
ncbi:MAG: hypothetical protein ILP11_04620 [Alphaproteobacteria bacterium]|nr:hypothetical protein [Alphaproteobacteria bacterium]